MAGSTGGTVSPLSSAPLTRARLDLSPEPRPGKHRALAGGHGGFLCLSRGFGAQRVCIPAHGGSRTPSCRGWFGLV